MSNLLTVGTGFYVQEEPEMFDKLIESNSVGADFKPRGRYFTVSSVIVGILFLAAVIVNLYAQDFGLGTNHFDMTEILAPIASDLSEPPRPRPEVQQRSHSQSTLAERRNNILQMDESPKMPSTISHVPNTARSRTAEDFVISTRDLDSAGPPASSFGDRFRGSGSTPDTATNVEPVARLATVPPPPPIKVVKMPLKTSTRSLGVINGIAVSLPKPVYSQAAQMMGVQGTVSVQVALDEAGKVISAKALSGHPLLRASAEKAAWGARFTPTKLSNVPVKVTGVIVYNFTR